MRVGYIPTEFIRRAESVACCPIEVRTSNVEVNSLWRERVWLLFYTEHGVFEWEIRWDISRYSYALLDAIELKIADAVVWFASCQL